MNDHQLRVACVKLAYENPEMREHLLPLLKQAMEFPSKESLEKYLKEHPGADRSNHKVAPSGSSPSKQDPSKVTKAENDGIIQTFESMDKDYDTRGALKSIYHALHNGKPLTKKMVQDVVDAAKDDAAHLNSYGFTSDSHRNSHNDFKKIQSWAQKKLSQF